MRKLLHIGRSREPHLHPTTSPKDWQRRLRHWKRGYSARALAFLELFSVRGGYLRLDFEAVFELAITGGNDAQEIYHR